MLTPNLLETVSSLQHASHKEQYCLCNTQFLQEGSFKSVTYEVFMY